MIYLLKIALFLFLVAWSGLGIWMIAKYSILFGPSSDHPSETPGERSFGVAHIGAIWFGFFALATYFFFK